MSRKERRLPFWACCLNDVVGAGSRNSFTMIGNDLLFCTAFNRLSLSARYLYIAMVAEARGQMRFIFPHRTYIRVLSNGGFDNARKELVQRGFIKLVSGNKNLRRPAEYEFTPDWKNRISAADCKACGRNCL